jgi:hypothetical protein
MMRISQSVNVFQLASNIGTSVEMLEDSYRKKRRRDPSMAAEVTKIRTHANRPASREVYSVKNEPDGRKQIPRPQWSEEQSRRWRAPFLHRRADQRVRVRDAFGGR